MADLFQLLQAAKASGNIEVEDRSTASGIDLQQVWSGILTSAGQSGGPQILTCANAAGNTVRSIILGDSTLGPTGTHILGRCSLSTVESMIYNIDASDWDAIESNFAPLTLVNQTNADVYVRAFDDTTEEYVNHKMILPSDLDTSGTVTFYAAGFSATAAASKNIELRFGHTSLADSEAQDVAYTNVDSGDLSVDSTQDDLDLLSFNATVSTLGWAAGDYVQFRLSRIDASANDLAGDWYLLTFMIDIPRA